MNAEDRKNLAAAALMGDHRTMRQVSTAQSAIVALLKGDMEGNVPLSDFHRYGLLVALEELANTLEDRAGYLEDEGCIGGGES